MTDIDLIINKRNELNEKLRNALSTMERKDDIAKIRLEILKNQRDCPHISSKYNWAIINDKCPYCGLTLYTKEREGM